MKKFIITLALILVSVSAFAATDIFVGLGVQNSKLSLEMSKPEKGDFSFDFKDKTIEGELAVIFDGSNGFKVTAGTEGFSGIKLGVGYVYTDNINANVGYSLYAGPTFDIKGKTFGLGADLVAAFQFYITNGFYIDVATGLLMEFVTFGNNNTDTSFTANIPLPRVSLGWKF